MVDLTTLTDDELNTLRADVINERARRQTLLTAPAAMEQLQAQYVAALGRVDGAEWVAPTMALDVYKLNDKVTRDGKTWESLLSNNDQMPGNPDDPQSYRWWRDLSTPPIGQNDWDGNGHDYAVDDLVVYQGNTYRVLQAHTSQPGWNPNAVPALYELVVA